MQLYNNYHLNLKHYFKTKLSNLEFSIWLHTFGRSLIALFIPIILYNVGFSISHIMLFLLIYCAIDVPLNFAARRLIIKIGAKKTIFLSMIAEIFYFIILYFAKLTWTTLVLLAITWAIFDAFYWVAHWFILNECIVVKKGVGNQVGLTKSIRQLGALFAPGIGALVLIFLNKNYLIGLTFLILLVSLVPLYKIKFDYVKPKCKKKFREFFKNKENKINFFSTSLLSIHNTNEAVLLPLFIFITFTSIGAVSILPMIGAVSFILFSFYIGKLTDKMNKRVMIFVGALLLAIVWGVRIFFPLMSVFYITTLVMGFLTVFIAIPIDSDIIKNAKKTSMLDASMYRNVSTMFIRIPLYLGLYIAIDKFKVSFVSVVFAMVMLSFFSLVVLLKEKKLLRQF